MRALVVTHTDSEDAGTLADWLGAVAVELDVVRLHAGDPVPAAVSAAASGHDALLVMGGPMAAYDEDATPWLRAEKAMLRATVEAATPILGVCLGGQLLAEACGGRVRRGRRGPELGAGVVDRCEAAATDPLFALAPATSPVVQWHWDEIDTLPPGAVLLASSGRYQHQAFRVGDRAWGVQFHVETPPEMVARWAAADAAALAEAGLDPEDVVSTAVATLPAIAATWRPVVERFAGLAALAGASSRSGR